MSVICQTRYQKLFSFILVPILSLGFFRPVISNAKPTSQPIFDGQIAYVFDKNIWVLDLMSGSSTQLTFNDAVQVDDMAGKARIAWSPDGSRLAFVNRDDFGRYFISVIGLNGVEIDSTAEVIESTYAPAFTPAGELAFVREIEPWDGNSIGGAHHQILVRYLDGTEQIIFERVDSTCEPSRLTFNGEGVLVLTEECRFQASASLIRNGEEIWIPALGSVGVCGAPIGRDYYARDAMWAYQQPLLAIVGGNCAYPEDSDWKDAIYLIDMNQPDMPARKILARDGMPINAVDWSPDDSWLVYDSADGLWTIGTAGGEPVQLAPVGAFPAWRPVPALPPAPPARAVDLEGARAQIADLRTAIDRLERIDLDTGILGLTITADSFDQRAARNLLNGVEQMLDQGTLTPDQLDALGRLTMADLALAQIRDDYASISIATADLIVDVAKLPFAVHGLASKLSVNDTCRTIAWLCGPAIKGLQSAAWSAAANAATPLIRLLPVEDRDLVDQQWRLLLAAEQVRFTSSSEPLATWFMDQVLSKALAGLLIRVHFTDKLQPIADQAVHSTDISSGEANRWAITGDAESAESFIVAYLRNSEEERRYISREFEDLSQRTEYLEVAESFTGLGGFLAPVLFKFQAALIAGRSFGLAELIRSTYAPALNCQTFRAEQVLEQSFDRKQFKECNGASGQNSLGLYYSQSSTAPHAPTRRFAPMQLRLLQDAANYRQTVESLVPALLADDQARAELLIADLVASAEAQQANLEEARGIILAQPQPGPTEALLAEGAGQFASNNLVLYLAILETASSRAEGSTPQTDLAAAAATALSDLTTLEDAAAQAILEPPQVSLPRIAKAAINTRDGTQILSVTIVNAGAADAVGLTLRLLDGDQMIADPVDMPIIAPGTQEVLELMLQSPLPPALMLQMSDPSGTVGVLLIDVPLIIEPAPAPSAVPTSAPVMSTAVPATPILSAETSQEFTGTPSPNGRGGNGGILLIGFALLVLIVVAGMHILGRRRS